MTKRHNTTTASIDQDKSSTPTPIQFHGDTIYSIEHDGQPYTPVRPIVENMGLDWASQSVKLQRSKERWGVVIITTPSKGGNQGHLCIPVRKLPGFLATINPLKVGNKLRPKIVKYQNECDDVLWDYWTKGHAVNPRSTLTPEQQRYVQKAVAERVKEWAPDTARKGYARLYSSIKDHFKVGSYKDIPTDRFNEILIFLQVKPPAQPVPSDKLGQLPHYQDHIPGVVDDFVQYTYARCDSIMDELKSSDCHNKTVMTICRELMRISSALGAMYPNEMRFIRFPMEKNS